ncbi:non-heme iron oxygenase ferredoxin subunit [Rhodopseudomonas palustris]|uniref:non-heme iron oxygenase ferredoxin subunit n=1 Tax=Rhodopseudomonas palustris TaxID=1076 RepID=UPI002ACDECA5|nr:non-heme iron oxygenase ferredoxin subunit [Rhodopseudomonas palustris]WQH00541.1 non-heme iron oxygenase ferredoxin subunit [Rhodopseudomonas palustris]
MSTIAPTEVRVGTVSDFPSGEIRAATLPDGTTVAVYNVDGQLYATADLCSHGEASLSEEGILTGKTVECPWHFGTFDVTDGRATGMPCTIPLKTFTVKIVDENVYVEF